MITLIVVGFVALVVLAVIIDVMEFEKDTYWRVVAAERRHRWEDCHPLSVGGSGPRLEVDPTDD